MELSTRTAKMKVLIGIRTSEAERNTQENINIELNYKLYSINKSIYFFCERCVLPRVALFSLLLSVVRTWVGGVLFFVNKLCKKLFCVFCFSSAYLFAHGRKIFVNSIKNALTQREKVNEKMFEFFVKNLDTSAVNGDLKEGQR